MRCKSLLIFLLIASPAAWSDGIPVEPGMWEMTATMNLPMMPEPRVTTTRECMKETEIDMDDVGAGDMSEECDFSLDQLDGNTMKWSVECPVEGGTSRGEWTATSAGDSVTGDGLLTMSFGGQTMEMTMMWEGKRVGPCP